MGRDIGFWVISLSEDGTEEIYHLMTKNSLVSNNILDLEINHSTGEVFISTDKGLMSFRNGHNRKY